MGITSIYGTKNKKGQIITDPREMMHRVPRGTKVNQYNAGMEISTIQACCNGTGDS